MSSYHAILIAGPTASGKSAFALAVARAVGGCVVNADSMQVYRELEILTARPGGAEIAQAPHALYGHVPAAEAYSVAGWLADVAAEIARLRQDDIVPVIVGGTGLYFKALLEGLSPIPQTPSPIRQRWREAATHLAPETLHALLAARDPDTAARLAPTDAQRLVRALEVHEATGRGLASWHGERGRPVLDQAQALRFVLSLDREDNYARADRRLDAMIAGGALAEVERLGRLRLGTDLPAMRALGVAPLLDAVAGGMGLDAAVAQAKLDTRHYIKRQATWLRRHMIAWNHVKTEDMERIEEQCFTLIRC